MIAIKSYGQWIGEEAIIAQIAENKKPVPRKIKNLYCDEPVEPEEPEPMSNQGVYEFTAQATTAMTVYHITIENLMKLEGNVKKIIIDKATQERIRRLAMLKFHTTIQKDITVMGK